MIIFFFSLIRIKSDLIFNPHFLPRNAVVHGGCEDFTSSQMSGKHKHTHRGTQKARDAQNGSLKLSREKT